MGKFFVIALVAIAAFSTSLEAAAITAAEIRFHDITADTTKINNILEECGSMGNVATGTLVDNIAMKLLDTSYKGGTLEGDPEMLTIDMTEMDCTTFAETVLALAITAQEKRSSWRDFAHHLQELRYRDGSVNGYASRLHYISDWIVENSHKGLIEEVTGLSELASREIRTLDFMTQNRAKYAALADDSNYEALKNVELGYRSHCFPYIKSRHITKFPLKNGDLVFFTTSTKGLDVSHVGLIHLENGTPHLLHASSKDGKVVLDKAPLATYMKRHPSHTGVRVVRLR